ncbi:MULTISPECIES: nucleoside deaminase [Halorubrum]|uniref:CMP/dCMP deaminase zinc-binding protein n=1 Tax=Halorubrum hochstenium ATCC 700873 TaxID=1227481 RepID=M0F266_9EURY|nr:MULTISPECIES: nucleoside deaminase [Halorubrum]ELZ53433.1 CMP/dCMP deaminase zinc-binding protein [Halorubrum hochstenium ATCC 700873]
MPDENELGAPVAADLPADATDGEYVARTIELAEEAVAAGNTPFGALLVVDGEAVREARNETRTDDDVAAHPELTLARWAASELDAAERAACTMYASTEPCPMCATAVHYAGVGRVVFGVDGETLDELSGGVVPIPCEEVIRRAGGETTVEGPIAVDAAMTVHESFFGEP